MTVLRQLVVGLLGAFISGLLVLGALSLATVEGMVFYTPTAENTATAGLPIAGQDTATPVPSPTAIPPTSCPPPEGWEGYTIQNGDTLEALSAVRGISVQKIIEGNCLFNETLLADKILFLPPLPTPTSTITPNVPAPTEEPTDTPVSPTVKVCGPPDHWSAYIVQLGDTLFTLANATGTTVSELMFANCLTDPNYIQAGMRIFLPRLPVHNTVPPTSTPTTRPPTVTPVPPSSTPVVIPPTDTPVPPPSDTPVPSTDVPTPVRPTGSP